jgi:hypothetical protein
MLTIRQRSAVPTELSTATSWESYRDDVKLAYTEWSAYSDKTRITLENDCWNLRMLFDSDEKRYRELLNMLACT